MNAPAVDQLISASDLRAAPQRNSDSSVPVSSSNKPEEERSMGITRLNHAVLFVRDLERSVAFYTEVLRFRRIDMTPEGFAGAAFLQAPGSNNDHDLACSKSAPMLGPQVPDVPQLACTTWPGRSTLWRRCSSWRIPSLRTAPWLVLRTTAPQKVFTARIRMAWSSRSLGSCRLIVLMRRLGRPVSRLAGSTSTARSLATVRTRTAESASRSRSADNNYPPTGARRNPCTTVERDAGGFGRADHTPIT